MAIRLSNNDVVMDRNVLTAAYALTLLFSVVLLAASWKVLLFKSTLSRGYTVNSPTVLLCEGASLVLSVMADTLLVGTCLRRMPLTIFYTLSVRFLRLLGSNGWIPQVMHRKIFRRSPRTSSPVSMSHPVSSHPVTVRSLSEQSGSLHNRGGGGGGGGCACAGVCESATAVPPPLRSPLVPPGPSASISYTLHLRRNLFIIVFVIVAVVHLAAHLLVHRKIPPQHKLSHEIVLALACCGFDGLLFLGFGITLSCLIIRQQQQLFAQRTTRGGGSYRRSLTLLQLLALVWFVWKVYCLARAYRDLDTVAHLQMSVLGPPVDPCVGEGMVLNPILRRSVVWPALTARRLFNFYTGSETCSTPKDRSIACLGTSAAGQKVLRVSATCWDGSASRVLLHHPANSELSGEKVVLVPEIRQGNLQYHKELEAAYGTAGAAAARGVTVLRHKDGRIAAVQWVPSATVTATAGQCDAEAQLSQHEHWWAAEVVEVPLGLSASYTVQCSSLQHEEVFMLPVPADLYSPTYVPPGSKAQPSCAAAEQQQQQQQQPKMETAAAAAAEEEDDGRPPANVLLLVLDSVSRPGMVRTLPKFTAWVRDFKRRAAMPGGSGHLVVEPTSYTTLGFSTAGNMGPLLTGRRYNLRTQTTRLLHNSVKEQYGDNVSTSFLSGYCHDYLEMILKDQGASSGNGGRYQGIDHYFYNPLCHLSYTGQHSNYRGPFSIQRRCIAGRMVADHLFNYSTLLLREQMHSETPSSVFPATCNKDGTMQPRRQRSFFDLIYLVDGHEGTHYAITLVDDALADFARRLEQDGFFADPRNVFIAMADHGSAMGHYFEFTNAGSFEGTVPAAVHFMHPAVMAAVDARKGRAAGEAFNNYMARVHRASSPLDLHLTLADLLGVTQEDPELDMAMQVARAAPASYFDARDGAVLRTCGALTGDDGKCTLSYCIPDPLQRSYSLL